MTAWLSNDRVTKLIRKHGLDFDMVAKAKEIDPKRLRIIYALEDNTIPLVNISLGYHFRNNPYRAF
jgi:hypothetical protein